MAGGGSGRVDYAAFETSSRAITEALAHIHAAHAEVALLLARHDDDGAWAGYRDCVEFLTVAAGLDRHSATELIRVGHAMKSLPALSAAFAGGELSLDKMRCLARVAEAGDERTWLGIARASSGSQLARICREYRRARDADSPERAARHRADRGLWTHWRDDGMLHLVALLPPEEGGIVLAAIEAAAGPKAQPVAANEDRPPVRDLAADRSAARRSDALHSVCRQVLESGPAGAVGRRSPAQMLVHVDVGVLAGDEPDGRCHVNGGPPLSTAVARMLGCSAELVAVTEPNGLPIDVGARRRFTTPRQQRALRVRDRFCRFPGCTTSAWLSGGHHIIEWWRGGPTVLANLVSLCKHHHVRCHEGAFGIRGDSRSARFHLPDGRLIGAARPPVLGRVNGGERLQADARGSGKTITHRTPRGEGAGERSDVRHTVWVLLNNRDHRLRKEAEQAQVLRR